MTGTQRRFYLSENLWRRLCDQVSARATDTCGLSTLYSLRKAKIVGIMANFSLSMPEGNWLNQRAGALLWSAAETRSERAALETMFSKITEPQGIES